MTSGRVGSARIEIEVDGTKVSSSLNAAMDKALGAVSKSAERTFSSLEASAAKAGRAVGGGVGDGAKAAQRAVDSINPRALDNVTRAADGAARSVAGAGTTASRSMEGAATSASRAAGNIAAAGTASSRAAGQMAQVGHTARSGFDGASSAAQGFVGKLSGIAVGLAAVMGPMAMLKGGFDRLMNIQRAEIGFKNVGLSAAETQTQMAKLTEQVTGTSVSLSDAAKYSAMFAQSGVEIGKPMDDSIKAFTSLAAAAQGTGTDVGIVMQQISASGRLLGGDAMQLQSAGINIYKYVADYMGKSMDEVKKLGEQGKITFEDVVGAINAGMGDYAKEMGETLPAKISNLKTSVASLGAALIEPFIGPLTAMVEFGIAVFKWVKQPLAGFQTWLSEGGVAVDVFKVAVAALGSAVVIGPIVGLVNTLGLVAKAAAFGAKAMSILNLAFLTSGPGILIMAIAGLVAVFALLWNKSEGFRNFFIGMWDSIVGKVTGVVDTLKAAWGEITAAFRGGDDGYGALGSLIGEGAAEWAVNAIASVKTAWTELTAAFRGGDDGYGALANIFGEGGAEFVVTAIAAVGSAFRTIKDAVVGLGPVLMSVWPVVRDALLSVWDSVKSLAASFMRIAQVVWPALKPVLMVLGALLGGVILLSIKALGWAFQLVAGIIANVVVPVIKVLATVFAWVAQGIAGAMSVVTTAIVWGWQNLILPIWDAMQVALGALGAFFQWVWTGVIQPVWNALGAGIRWVYDTVIAPAWEALKFALSLVGEAFRFYWENVINPLWTALGNGIRWVYDTIIAPAWDALKIALGAVGDFFQWVWNSVIKPAWDALGNGIRWVLDTVVHPAFEGLKTGLGFVRDAFQTAVDFIGQMWDRIKGITAAPIKFVIDTVYNNGIRAVWNKVAGWLGLDELGEMPMPRGLEGYASGGVLPGYTPGRDVHRFVNPATGQGLALSGGEAIMRPEWTRAIGGPAEVERQNKLAMAGQIRHGRESAAFADGGVLAFAGGGIVDAMTRIVQAKYPMLQMTSGYRASNDLHGQGMAGDFSNGSGNTPAQLALANDIADTYPGSMELIYDSPGFDRTIKNGQIVGPFGQFYTWGQAGNHQHHVHWAMNTPPTMPFGGGVFEGGSDGSAGGGGMSMVRAAVSRAFSTILDPILEAIPDFGGGLWGGLPGALIGKLVDGAKEHLSSLAGVFGGGSSLDLSGIAGDNLTIGQAAAEMVGWTGGEWAALKELWTRESGWNNNAQNPTSTAYGIAQFLDTTWADFGPKTSDPAKQIEYGIRYIQQRYGTPSAALAFHDANNWYDQGGVAAGTGAMLKNTIKPERVLNPAQTEAFEAWMEAGQRFDEINALVASVQAMQLDSPEVMADEIGRRVAEWIGEEQEPGSLRALAAALQSGVEWERVAAGMQRSAEAWANGEWVQVAEDRRLATPHEMASQVGENFLEEIAGELGGMIGLSNPYTARSIVDETGTIQLPQAANEIVPVTGDAPTVKADSGAVSAAAVGEGTKETINVAVEVNVNGVQDPMAVGDVVVERLGRGIEQAFGGTGRSL